MLCFLPSFNSEACCPPTYHSLCIPFLLPSLHSYSITPTPITTRVSIGDLLRQSQPQKPFRVEPVTWFAFVVRTIEVGPCQEIQESLHPSSFSFTPLSPPLPPPLSPPPSPPPPLSPSPPSFTSSGRSTLDTGTGQLQCRAWGSWKSMLEVKMT